MVTSTQAATLGSLAASIAVLFILAIVAVPRLARLLFLHRIEVIRDNCLDAILDDRLRETTSVKSFLRLVEMGSELPRLITLPRLLAMSRAMVNVGIDLTEMTPPPPYTDLGPAERTLMLKLDKCMCDAYMAYLNWGSPSSFVLRPLSIFVSRIHPGSAFAKAEDAVSVVARETLRNIHVQPAQRNLSYGEFAGQ